LDNNFGKQLPNFIFSLYRFELELEREIKAGFFLGNTIRGAFGSSLRSICCVKKRKECVDCPLALQCAYQHIFSPIWMEEYHTLSKNRNIQRGFVIKPPLKEDYTRFLSFEMVLIGRLNKWLPYVIVPFRELGNRGLGANRIPFKLSQILIFDFRGKEWFPIYSSKDETVRPKDLAIEWKELLPEQSQKEKITLNFFTPTTIRYNFRKEKGKSVVVRRPEFHILIKRLRDRINALLNFYCGEKLDIDFRAFGKEAEKIKKVEDKTLWKERKRKRADGKIHNLSGFTGRVTFEGEIDEFIPYLVLGQYIHVGENAPFGNGWYEIV